MAKLLGITRFWNYISDWIECRVHLRPEKDNTIDLGSRDYRWRTIYTGTAIGARVYNDAAITVGNASWTVLTFNTERFDTDGIHSTSTNSGRLTCVTPGTYLITGHLVFAANATGVRGAALRLDGSTFLAVDTRINLGSSLGNNLSIATIYQLAANQYVELCAYQNSGGNLNVTANAAYSPEFAMVRLA